MNIVVCLKEVPDTETKVAIADGKSLKPDGVTFIPNPYDEFAIEEALSIKEAQGDGTVTLLSLAGGAGKPAETLRKGLAMGADKAVLLQDDAFVGLDALATANVLAAAIEKIGYDLVLCGKQAIDLDQHQVPARLAEALGVPQACVVTQLEIGDGKATAHREIEGGEQVVEIPLPAVISAQKGLNEPRYASLKGIMQAKKKPMDTWGLGDLGDVNIESKCEIVVMSLPPERPEGKLIEGEPEEQVKELVRLLREEAKVI